MDTFEDFRDQLREALSHLKDPDYHPSPIICAVIGRGGKNDAALVQNIIIQAIKDLEPPAEVPPLASTRRNFDVLYHRFVLGFTQEKTAELFQMSVRSLGRIQREATHMLGRLLWQHGLAREISAQSADNQKVSQTHENIASEIAEVDWHSQLRRELSSLQTSAPGALANVSETINSVVRLESLLTGIHAANLVVEPMPTDLIVSIHPSALRQILILAIAQMLRCTLQGQVTIHTTLAQNSVGVILAGRLQGNLLPDSGPIQEILALQNGSASIIEEKGHIQFVITLPASVESTVLVVDDNPDMVHFYRRCTAGTRYRIVDAGLGGHTLQDIQTARPDIIVLDLMLPDIDGWDLLAQLQKETTTRTIPIIVCSIIGEKDLISALGAAIYLPKPVLPRNFIQALDQVLSPTST
jgi:CheY-like chemotaxis protein